MNSSFTPARHSSNVGLKMIHYLIAILATITLISCKSDVTESAPTSIEQAWISLISTKGCLLGSQDAIDGLREGTCLIEEPWLDFLAYPTPNKIDFLTRKLVSTDKTKIHNCCVGNTTEGELAVYSLQHLTHSRQLRCNSLKISNFRENKLIFS